MKLKMVNLDYEDVGILLLPKPIYQDKEGNLWRYDVSWEKENRISEKEMKELLHKRFPKIIEGEKVFENKYHNWIGIRDKRGIVYRFEKIEQAPVAQLVEHPM